MTYVIYVLHSRQTESHADLAVDQLRAAGHQAESVDCDQITINALRGMPAVIVIVDASKTSAFLDSLASASNLGLRATLFSVRTIGEQVNAVSRQLVSHLSRHGGQQLGASCPTSLSFIDWARFVAQNLHTAAAKLQ